MIVIASPGATFRSHALLRIVFARVEPKQATKTRQRVRTLSAPAVFESDGPPIAGPHRPVYRVE